MASLVESGMKNLNFGDADSVGFFQMRVGIWNQGEYAGYPDKPELQVKWFLDNAEQVKKQRRGGGQADRRPELLRRVDRRRRAARRAVPLPLPGRSSRRPRTCSPSARPRRPRRPVSSTWPPRSLRPAETAARSAPRRSPTPRRSKGSTRPAARTAARRSSSTSPSAKVGPGNPWCASFVTWSLEQAGHKMPGGGWAAVQTWVRNAEQGNNGLQIVSAEDARPGDIVAYDWGGQNDFGSDGHIGFLKSDVKGRQVHRAGGQQQRPGRRRPAEHQRRERRVHPHQRRRAGRRRRRPSIRPPRPGAPPAAASQPIDPKQFGGEGTGTGGPPNAEALALLEQQEHRARLDRDRRHQGRPDRPARDRRADQAQPGARDHGLVHVLGPLEVHGRRLGLQPLLRPRRRHRRDRRRDGRAGQRDRARGGERALVAGPEHPAERDRLAVGDLRCPATSPTPPTRTTSTSASSRRSPPDWKPPADVAAAVAAAPGTPVAAPFRARPSRRSPRRRRRASPRSCS